MTDHETQVQAKTMLPLSEFHELARTAQVADRSIAAEIRVAIRSHLKANGSAASSSGKRDRAATKGR